ncbi:N-acetylmuramoyl-L-alanine amidase family protein [Paenibacillus xylanexedens]|uniref:N-acetylmuramoyl-L-alanine amidase family protein n=1 Tax=Paenibacillus xylanexedens TaxID=528191 RepID=UPI0011AABCE9|nr:N-acetylmuramoyl-L-alanine amidase [Paenibacillus xylanexedens]
MSLRGKKIFIDPGHGGSQSAGNSLCGSYQVGTSGKLSGNEKDSVLVIGEALKSYFEAAGAVVRMSRTTDVPVCLGTRAKAANDWGANIFLSLHHNGSTNTSANGLSAHWYKASDEKLAKSMVPRMVEYTGLNTWGTTGVRKDSFQVLRDTKMPATLLEFGFMSNPSDDAFISSYESKLDFCAGVVKGAADYFA